MKKMNVVQMEKIEGGSPKWVHSMLCFGAVAGFLAAGILTAGIGAIVAGLAAQGVSIWQCNQALNHDH